MVNFSLMSLILKCFMLEVELGWPQCDHIYMSYSEPLKQDEKLPFGMEVDLNENYFILNILGLWKEIFQILNFTSLYQSQ